MTTPHSELLDRIDQGLSTPQDAAALVESLMTGGTADAAPAALQNGEAQPGGAPAAAAAPAPATEEPAAAAPLATPPELDASNAVILSRNGKYTIDYSELLEARNAEKAAVARAAELEAQLQEARARQEAGKAPTAADTNAAIAQKAIDSGVEPGIFGDFSEEAIAKGVDTLVARRLEPLLAAKMQEVDARFQEAVAPVRKHQEQLSAEAHLQSILKTHPDALDISQSKELTDWIGSQPKFAQAAINAVLDSGGADAVIEVLDSFKKATATAAAPTPAADAAGLKAKAKEALASAAPPVPSSLTDIPGGRQGAANQFEAMDALAPHELSDALMKLSSEQREAYLNRTA